MRPTVGGYLRGGAKIAGFGHPLYPEGDGRARCLMALLNRHLPDAPGVQVANELCAAVYDALGQQPTIDLALSALAAALGAPPHAPLTLFALGRTAGWIAHAAEQYALDQLIRPRARYVGLRQRFDLHSCLPSPIRGNVRRTLQAERSSAVPRTFPSTRP